MMYCDWSLWTYVKWQGDGAQEVIHVALGRGTGGLCHLFEVASQAFEVGDFVQGFGSVYYRELVVMVPEIR